MPQYLALIHSDMQLQFLVTDTECVVLERTLSDRDWPDPELLTLHTHGSEPGLVVTRSTPMSRSHYRGNIRSPSQSLDSKTSY